MSPTICATSAQSRHQCFIYKSSCSISTTDHRLLLQRLHPPDHPDDQHHRKQQRINSLIGHHRTKKTPSPHTRNQ